MQSPQPPSAVQLDAERYLLANAFHDAAWLATAKRDLIPSHFACPKHQTIWRSIIDSTPDGNPADEISILADLELNHLTDQAGGRTYLNSVSSLLYGPSPSVNRWQEQILSAGKSRSLLNGLDILRSKAESGAFTAEEIAADTLALANALTASDRKKGDTGPSRFDFADLLNFDKTADPTSVLGNRWLCKGGSLLIVGQSGTGKSSLMMQAAVHWALGRDFFGIKPARPLRAIILQAENDAGDVSEALQDVVAGAYLDSQERDQLRESLAIFRDTVSTGTAFTAALADLVREHRADIVFVDPLLSFAGIDVSDQEQASKFLRVTEEDAEEVAFRRHVVRRSHGREALGFGGVGALGQDALRRRRSRSALR